MWKRKRVTLVTIALVMVVLLLAGCAELQEARRKWEDPNYIPSANDLTRISEEWPSGDPLKPTAQAAALERFATAQAHESAAEAAELQRQKEAEAAERQYSLMTAEAQMTQAAHQQEMEKRWQWATQQAANATEVYQATQAAISVEATRTAQHAQATATERAYRATSTAEVASQRATATKQAASDSATATKQAANDIATATRAAWEGQTTATAEAHTATAVMAQATMTRQAERREQTMGAVRDFGLPILGLLVGGVVLIVALQVVHDYLNRPVPYDRSILGDFQPLAFKDGEGGWTLIDLDRQPGHVTRVLPNGEVDVPRVRTAGQEERTTARDQAMDMNTRPQIGERRKHELPEPQLPTEAPPKAPAPGLRSVRVLRKLEQVDHMGFFSRPLLESMRADWEVER